MSDPNKTTLSQLKVLCRLAAPIILGNFAYSLLGISDILMAGMAGTDDQAGVAIGGSFFFPAMTFIIGMLSALHPVISRHRGADTKERIPLEHAHALISSLIAGFIIMGILLFLAFFCVSMESSQRMEDVTREYVFYIALCMPICAVYVSSRCYCEAMGNTQTTLYLGFAAVCINIPLNYVFIFGKLGMPAMGGVGCGVATLISFILSMIIVLSYIRLHPKLKHHWWINVRERPSLKGVLDFTKLSLPLGVSTSVECSCFTLIALLLSPLGPAAVSANTIGMSMTSFVFNIPLSLGIATSIMVGYAIGQNNLNTLRFNIKAAYAAMILSIGISVTILLSTRTSLPQFFNKDPEVIALASTLLCFAAVNQIFESAQTIQAFILRGFKDTRTILSVTLIAFYCVALPIGIGLCYGYLPFFFDVTGPKGFWIGLFCGLLAAAALYRMRVLHHYRGLKAMLQSEAAADRA